MYLEILPHDCPPDDAADVELKKVYRILRGSTANIEAFQSHAALKKPRPPAVCECRWHSCSLFECREKVQSIAKLPRFRQDDCRLAVLDIPRGSGRSSIKNKHVDFWAYDKFNFLASIVSIESVQ